MLQVPVTLRSFGERLAQPGVGRPQPVRLVPIGFLIVIAVGTGVLMLPWASVSGQSAPLLTALFTAVSATCVTGLVTVDTGSFWSPLGQAAILTMIQIGGLGTLVVTTLLLLALSDRLSLSQRLLVSAENRGVGMSAPEARIKTAIQFAILIEAVGALILFLWTIARYGASWRDAWWPSLFHSVSAFNNAGFGLRPDSLIQWAADPVVLLVLCASVVLGGIGLPVVAEVRYRTPGQALSLHTRLTLIGTIVLLIGGAILTWLFEHRAGGALSGMSSPVQALNAVVHSVMLRTAGFNAIDIAALSDASILFNCILMVIGGGSVGTAGGIKVTTVVVIVLLVWSELRGAPDTVVLRRRLPTALQREALAIAAMAALAIGFGTMVVLAVSDLPMRDVLFEASSAFATVGLSTGITAKLPPAAQVVIMLLMFIGRVGPIALGAALALRTHPRLIRYPEERPIIG